MKFYSLEFKAVCPVHVEAKKALLLYFDLNHKM